MPAFLEILRFEIRYQLSTGFFWLVLASFFLIHFLAIATTGINLGGDNPLVNINSAYKILFTEAALAYFGMLPIIIFMVSAINRDHETRTAEFFLISPISKTSFLLGRFWGGFVIALLIAVAGLLGNLVAVFMPWLDQSRLTEFSLLPYAFSFLVIILPYTFVVCSLFFAVAALSRSVALTFAMALLFMLVNVLFFANLQVEGLAWKALADPVGIVAITAQVRYWTVSEFNSLLPVGSLFLNRAIWISVGVLVLSLACKYFRTELSNNKNSMLRFRFAQKAIQDKPFHTVDVVVDYTFICQVSQFTSQLRMDILCVLRSPFFYAVIVFGITGVVGEHNSNVDLFLGLPLIPVTSGMLDFFRLGLFQYVVLILVYFSGELIHRERDSRVYEIISTLPYPNWIMPVAKAVALMAVICVLLVVSMLTSILMQVLAGYDAFEIGLYLQGLFVYNGFYFAMMCVLVIMVQTLSANKWLGMLLSFCLIVLLQILPMLGFENLLYGFRIPPAVYSDMNGYALFSQSQYSLMGYWGVFCVLLLLLAHLFFPRGYYASLRQHLEEAGSRITSTVQRIAVLCLLCFGSLGFWIYYNTSLLNEYQTVASLLELDADYEKSYGSYENRPTPTFTDISLEIDLFPEQRRLESRGSAVLENTKTEAIEQFVISLNPKLELRQLTLESGTISIEDVEQGFYLFDLAPALQPGETLTLDWDLSRVNRGFVNGNPDVEIVRNGSFIESPYIMPMPGYLAQREISDNAQRSKFGLGPAPRLPRLGDPDYLNIYGAGVGSRSNFKVIFSTSVDQIAVTSGILQREWYDQGRRYFEYKTDQPIMAGVPLVSARYEVARDTWNNVSLEIYHHEPHDFNTQIMLATAKQSLEYFSREFSPYQYDYFRIMEYPRYVDGAKAYAGTTPYSESVGFVSDLAAMDNADFTTMHELSHQWWGGQAYGAYMQGRQMLNEGLASYSALMVFKEYKDPMWFKRILARTLDAYLESRSDEAGSELPLMYTEDQGYISYNKGALAIFALQDVMGSERVHLALRNYLEKFSFAEPPYPTSQDLVNELRLVAPQQYQNLITDLFEKIVLYDVRIDSAVAVAIDGGYELTMDFSAAQFEADGQGVETEVPLETYFTIAIFPESDEELVAQTPLYEQKHLLHSGSHRLTFRIDDKPGAIGIDPFHIMIDKRPDNNTLSVSHE